MIPLVCNEGIMVMSLKLICLDILLKIRMKNENYYTG